jgi:exopolysaccharide biosynthesis polyprenyl glycosylphosphotransferase
MGDNPRKTLRNVVQLCDIVVMLLCFGLGTITVSHIFSRVTLSEFLSLRVKIQNVLLFLGFIYLWNQVLVSFGMYESRRLSRRRDEAMDVLRATSVATGLIYIAAVLFHVEMVNYIFIAVFWFSVTLTTMAGRFTVRTALRQIRLHGKNLRYMLIAGTNEEAVRFASKLEQSPWLGYRLAGFVDEEWPGLQSFYKSGYCLACSFSELRSYLRSNVVDEIVVTLPMRSKHPHASEIAQICEEQGITLRFVSNIFGLKHARSRTEEFEGDSHITHHRGTMPNGWAALIKRSLDFSLSLLLIVFLSPLLLITAALIKLSSPGPILFLQERMGLNKRRFHILKFRTMVADAERRMKEIEHLNEVSGPVFKIKNDPRITSVGKFLRKTSIDELPQLFNVLKGDMSLVGPRPMAVRDYEGFSEDWHRRRFSVRPGITCLWQVLGRNSIPFEKWMELDLQYIDQWSLWLDLEILMKTIPAVLKGSGAA